MNKAMLVLAKRSSTNRPSNVREASRVPDLISSENIVNVSENAVGVENGAVGIEVVDHVGKRIRGDGDEESSRRVSLKKAIDPLRFGSGKSLAITGVRKDGFPPMLQPCSLENPLQIEIRSNERWTAGLSYHVQVFSTFDLPQDMGS